MNTEAIILYLSQHFRENVQLADLAMEANLSKFHFHRLFTAEIGITPQQYVEKLRVEHAAHFMIVYPQASLQEVAFESGYSSPACFSRSFRKRYAMAPSVFRNRFISNEPSTIGAINKVSIQYLSSQKVYVTKANLTQINQAYQQFLQQQVPLASAIGFYIDAPFHSHLHECRHFIGSDKATAFKQSIVIPAGYYTSIKVKGPFDTLRAIVTQLKASIEAAGYMIESLSAFERIQLPASADAFDYFSTERELFLKVKRP